MKSQRVRHNWATKHRTQTFSSVHRLSHVQLFATPWIAARQASLSITISRSLLKLMSIESVMPSNHLILLSPSVSAFNLSQHEGLFQWVGSYTSGGQKIGASASASVLAMSIQGWIPLGLTGLILLCKGLSVALDMSLNFVLICLIIHKWKLQYIHPIRLLEE